MNHIVFHEPQKLLEPLILSVDRQNLNIEWNNESNKKINWNRHFNVLLTLSDAIDILITF
jgi:hypothetical protein